MSAYVQCRCEQRRYFGVSYDKTFMISVQTITFGFAGQGHVKQTTTARPEMTMMTAAMLINKSDRNSQIPTSTPHTCPFLPSLPQNRPTRRLHDSVIANPQQDLEFMITRLHGKLIANLGHATPLDLFPPSCETNCLDYTLHNWTRLAVIVIRGCKAFSESRSETTKEII
ncbi:hypothetical protein C8R42DRAFT_719897 [Lentinula raphanica]|nr:hypothetical protein C8R42DRAFT_719897 [Lentinula raphanica]